MTASDNAGPLSGAPVPPQTPRRRRFAGERAGAWLFAASFSVGIWGLALKVLSPSHVTVSRPDAPVAVAMIAPSGDSDGGAKVYWMDDSFAGYPLAADARIVTFDQLSGDRNALM